MNLNNSKYCWCSRFVVENLGIYTIKLCICMRRVNGSVRAYTSFYIVLPSYLLGLFEFLRQFPSLWLLASNGRQPNPKQSKLQAMPRKPLAPSLQWSYISHSLPYCHLPVLQSNQEKWRAFPAESLLPRLQWSPHWVLSCTETKTRERERESKHYLQIWMWVRQV